MNQLEKDIKNLMSKLIDKKVLTSWETIDLDYIYCDINLSDKVFTSMNEVLDDEYHKDYERVSHLKDLMFDVTYINKEIRRKLMKLVD